jgi:3-deoxy-D-manno-octulosonic-acid transferase
MPSGEAVSADNGVTRWQGAVARRIYSAVLSLLLPAFLARIWWRGRAEPLYRHAVAERFGRYGYRPSSGFVWIHAVSLGETRAAEALIAELRSRLPGMRMLLTHGTATGLEAGRTLLRDGDVQTWLPYDLANIVRRFLARFKPVVGVLMETEIWPNLLFCARQTGMPMVLANARLSPRSYAKGKRLAALLWPATRALSSVLAQTEADAKRLRDAGAARVEVCGNLKFDLTPDARQLAQGRAWCHSIPRPVVLAAITREGEEALLLQEWVRLAEPRPLLLIVPRHPQRFDEVAALVKSFGLSLARRSGWGAAPPAEALAAQVWLGDSMREMALYYATAQVALLGGSFAPLGGQNLIEAAACGCPIIMGPHTFNFADAAELSVAAGAGVRVANMSQALAEALAMLAPEVQKQHSARALEFASQHRGAAARMAQSIADLLNPASSEG